MGRQRIGKNLKKPSDYDFPEQRKLSKGLRIGDMKVIAVKTGYAISTINAMCLGKRKMNKDVNIWISKLTEHNKQFEKITAKKIVI